MICAVPLSPSQPADWRPQRLKRARNRSEQPQVSLVVASRRHLRWLIYRRVHPDSELFARTTYSSSALRTSRRPARSRGTWLPREPAQHLAGVRQRERLGASKLREDDYPFIVRRVSVSLDVSSTPCDSGITASEVVLSILPRLLQPSLHATNSPFQHFAVCSMHLELVVCLPIATAGGLALLAESQATLLAVG